MVHIQIMSDGARLNNQRCLPEMGIWPNSKDIFKIEQSLSSFSFNFQKK